MIDIITKRLDNGALCCLIPKKDYVSKEAMISFKYGSADISFISEGKNITHPMGTAHFLEHKMFEDKHKDITSFFSKLGLSVNAYTNFSTTAYYFTGCGNFYEGFKLLRDMVSQIYVTDENIDSERSIIAQEINMYNDDPYWQVYFNLLKAMYSQNPVRYSIAGSQKDIDHITKETLEESYSNFYTYENCIIIGCGDIDAENFFTQAENITLNNADICKTSVSDTVKSHSISAKMPVVKPLYNIGFRDNNLKSTIQDRICVNNIILNILFAKSSSLYEKLSSQGLANDNIAFEVLQGPSYSASIIKGEGSAERVLEQTLFYIKDLLKYGIPSETLERTIYKIKTDLLFASENISAITDFTADCYSKNTEVLDIYNNYDKIDVDKILSVMEEQYTCDNAVISVIEPL